MPEVRASPSKSTEYEIIDSGNGKRSQTLPLPTIHFLKKTVWVNELPVLSLRERTELEAHKIVLKKTDRQGNISKFWVRWKEVENFAGSNKDDRHYTVDKTTGTLTFGDGVHGRIPPGDLGNIRIIFTTGAGNAGNIFADDISLSPEGKQQLFEICYVIKKRGIVPSDRKSKNRLKPGKGLYILLSGPSCPAKTETAGIIAREAGLDMYNVDLSSIVSRYIGETQKNLDRIFTEAETGNAILFFDEADALFGKRTSVRDAHDRYLPAGVKYFLRKMEEHEGIVILAGTVSNTTDDDLRRRMDFSVVFT
jgi:hypothetical protein